MGRTLEWLRESGSELGDAVFPRRCYLCGRFAADGLVCDEHTLPGGPPGPRCGICAGPLPGPVPDGARCAACRSRSPGFRAVVALADYRAQPVCRAWLLALKYGGRRDVAIPLGTALGRAWLRRAPAPWREQAVLVPVPLHWRRRLERGFDQARALTVHAAHATGLPWTPALTRHVATGVQGGPGSASRAANVRGAFRGRRGGEAEGRGWTRRWAPPRVRAWLDRRASGGGRGGSGVEDRCVWLVDDVVTSGATVAECARELRRGGARAVCVLTVARAGALGPTAERTRGELESGGNELDAARADPPFP